MSGPFWQPVIHTTDYAEDNTRHENIMKMRYDEISVVILKINRRYAHHQTRKTTQREHEQHANREQHRRFKSHRASPHGCRPVKNFNTRWNRNRHGCVHEEQLTCQRHTDSKHMMRPNKE